MIKENFIKLYENSFRENWDLPCYTDYGEDTQYTYGEVAEKIARLHLLFKHCSLHCSHPSRLYPQRYSSYRQSFRICISVHQRQHLGQSGRGNTNGTARRILTDRFPVSLSA